MKFFKNKKGEALARPDGHVRLSQVVSTFGPGAMVDLVDQAVIVSGLDAWEYSKFDTMPVLEELRLREHIVNRYRIDLAPDQAFRLPPAGKDDEATPWSGIPVIEFPHWFVCQGCDALVRAGDGLELTKSGRREHDCASKRGSSRCVPVRFVGACPHGHLQDYPWTYFAHEAGACVGGTLKLREGSAGDFSQIRVVCSCGAPPRRLVDAMMKETRPKCDGRRDWLGPGGTEPCNERLHLLVRTASNGYFPQVLSALSIPEPQRDLARDVHRVWAFLEKVATVEDLSGLRKFIAAQTLEPIAKYNDVDIVATVTALREGKKVETVPLRVAEYKRLVDSPLSIPDGPADDPNFQSQRIEVPKSLEAYVRRIVLVHKLREVRAQIGFTRLEPPTMDAQGEIDLDVELSPLTLRRTWLPATEVWGEGVFIELSEEAIEKWSLRPAVSARRDALFAGHQEWVKSFMARSPVRAEKDGKAKKREEPPFLSLRFYLLHTLSHMLISAISLECGYAASAIRERIYCGPTEDDDTPMAGILLSTGTSGSEGTLGGLVEQGRKLPSHLRRALEDSTLCSNDPVCAQHTPAGDPSERYLEGAACHGCLFVAECSCERFNRYLDRALVVRAMGHDPELAFFGQPA